MVCCVTGHRPQGFPFKRNEDDPAYVTYLITLSEQINQLICEGCTHFISGMASGADLDFADAILARCSENNFIFLEAALPYPISPTKKETEYQEWRDRILLNCAQKTVISPYYHRGCMQLRNRYMVDHADIVLAIWNGEQKGGTWDTIQYARSQGKNIRYIMLHDIENHS